MLQNAYFLAKIGADTAENEQHFAEFRRSLTAPPRGGGSCIKTSRDGQARTSDLVARLHFPEECRLLYVTDFVLLLS